MKRNLFVILSFFIILIVILTYVYYNYIKINLIAEQTNKEFEKYTIDSITGSSLITLINKTIDENEKNNVQKDRKGNYIENDKDSIKIEIKFSESNKTFSMESVNNLGVEAFVKNYNNILFKCIKKEYHKNTNKIKYMLFEQL